MSGGLLPTPGPQLPVTCQGTCRLLCFPSVPARSHPAPSNLCSGSRGCPGLLSLTSALCHEGRLWACALASGCVVKRGSSRPSEDRRRDGDRLSPAPRGSGSRFPLWSHGSMMPASDGQSFGASISHQLLETPSRCPSGPEALTACPVPGLGCLHIPLGPVASSGHPSTLSLWDLRFPNRGSDGGRGHGLSLSAK